MFSDSWNTILYFYFAMKFKTSVFKCLNNLCPCWDPIYMNKYMNICLAWLDISRKNITNEGLQYVVEIISLKVISLMCCHGVSDIRMSFLTLLPINNITTNLMVLAWVSFIYRIRWDTKLFGIHYNTTRTHWSYIKHFFTLHRWWFYVTLTFLSKSWTTYTQKSNKPLKKVSGRSMADRNRTSLLSKK